MANVPRIRDVWAPNLDQEMHTIRSLVDQYPYISMDTEFPGVVARPIGTFKTSSDYHYQTMRCNVDLLKIIQIGITLSDANGNMPDGTCTWQFNFHFTDSIENLQKAGLDFSRHEDPQYGIKPNDFAELLITSGLFITRSIRATKGGLQEIADELGVSSSAALTIGPLQQAGSDALLTSMTFFKMKEHYFPDQFDESKYSGQLYGLGPNYNPLASSPSAPTPAHVHHTAVSHNMNISLPGMGMQMNGMNSMGMGQPFPTPGLYPTGSVGTPFGPSGPTPPTHGGGMSGMGMGGVGMYGMPGHNVR
ncbi:CCR4-NOT transcription complex subunit 7 [Rhizoctonia solani AG-1 IA]|uniref:poly(A)-specific ribonuclease n=1 Tax=Thanatephorus cucumeris (strain AG1-IA) TaxID=983506 RepID=L8X6Y9_THACA|nr:CCR4-NOT transcription complex subunit 7 [Rhizoctonia solani AG-1 IA]